MEGTWAMLPDFVCNKCVFWAMYSYLLPMSRRRSLPWDHAISVGSRWPLAEGNSWNTWLILSLKLNPPWEIPSESDSAIRQGFLRRLHFLGERTSCLYKSNNQNSLTVWKLLCDVMTHTHTFFVKRCRHGNKTLITDFHNWSIISHMFWWCSYSWMVRALVEREYNLVNTCGHHQPVYKLAV